jgi:hypothetical protein
MFHPPLDQLQHHRSQRDGEKSERLGLHHGGAGGISGDFDDINNLKS